MLKTGFKLARVGRIAAAAGAAGLAWIGDLQPRGVEIGIRPNEGDFVPGRLQVLIAKQS